MMMLTSLGSVPGSMAFTLPVAMGNLLIAALVVSGLAVAATMLGRWLHRADRLPSPVAPRALHA